MRRITAMSMIKRGKRSRLFIILRGLVNREERTLQKEKTIMASKEEITGMIKAQFANMKVRGRVLGQALKARADIAATRRRLRTAFADLGEKTYGRMAAGGWKEDAELSTYKVRIEGIKAELQQQETALKEIVAEKGKEPAKVEVAPEESTADE